MTPNFNKIIELGYALYNPETHPVRCFHFSVILYKNRLISAAVNSPKTHPINLRNPKYGYDNKNITDIKGSCSEMSACLKLKRISNIDFEKCSLINIRINRLGHLANSRPCSSCESLLNYFSFKDVFYTNDRGIFERFV